MSFSEGDCTKKRGLKATVQPAPDSSISGLLCTKLVYAQCSYIPRAELKPGKATYEVTGELNSPDLHLTG
ncbi:MAG: hypothetical protein OSW71_18535, partial [Proteobacteria bacterium]|nr:hypothetical protein [Pseudomonadota bacterium]